MKDLADKIKRHPQGVFGILFLGLWWVSQFYEGPIYQVMDFLQLAVSSDDSGYLLAATGILVVTNAGRALLLFEGWFLVGSAAGVLTGRPVVQRLVPLAAIPACYQFVAILDFPSVPHFGMPAVLGLVSVFVIQYLTRDVSRWANRALALGLILFSLQWLDVIPALTHWGFGWGELSRAIKLIAELPGKEQLLNITGGISFLGVFAGAMVTIELMASYEKRLAQVHKLRSQERELAALREEQLRARGIREMQRLVHDLKRPLTTITGLADVLTQTAEDPLVKRHAGIILGSAGTMDRMISEILSPRARRPIPCGEVMDYALSQVRPFAWSDQIEVFKLPGDDQPVAEVNLIRFSRALINLLDNAHRATVDREVPKIRLSCEEIREGLAFIVEDNGEGLPEHPRPHRSGWGSTGLGLAFVEEVVGGHGGSLRFGRSALGGARVEIRLSAGVTKGGDPA